MNINSINTHYVAIQSHDDNEEKAVWTIIGHCLYEEEAREIARICNGGDAGRLYYLTESVLDFVREQGAIIKNGRELVDEVKGLVAGIDTEAFYMVHRENEKGKTLYRAVMRFTDNMLAQYFCYDNSEALGSDFFVLTGEQLKSMNGTDSVHSCTTETVPSCTTETVPSCTTETVHGLTIDNPIFRMSVVNMLSAITNIAYDDAVTIVRNTKTGLEAVARMTADEIMVSEYQACCVLAITVGHGEHRVIIA